MQQRVRASRTHHTHMMRSFVWTILLLNAASERLLLESIVDVGPFSTHPCRDEFVCSSWANLTSEVVNETLVLYSGSPSVLRARERLSTQRGVVRLRGEVTRNGALSCENHIMMMSGSPDMEDAWQFAPLDGAVFATWNCNGLFLVCPDGNYVAQYCETAATISIELELREGGVSFSANNGSSTCELFTACGLADIALNDSLSVYFGANPSDSSASWTSVSAVDYSAPSSAPTTSAPSLTSAPTVSVVPSFGPTMAPSCAAFDPESAFEFVGGTLETRRGVYMYLEPCGCRPLYQCLDCMVESSIFFHTDIGSWVAATGGCGSLNYTHVAEDPAARTPYEIGTVWNEIGGTVLVPNSTIEVAYAVNLQGTTFTPESEELWLGRYERRGTCDGRPAFERQRLDGTFSYLYFSFLVWIVGNEGCGSDVVGLAAIFESSATTRSPLAIPDGGWTEPYAGALTPNPTLSSTLVDISPTASPSLSPAPSTSPAPSSSPKPSTASPSVEPLAMLELVESPCLSESWTCPTANGTDVVGLSFYTDIRSTYAVFHPDRRLVTSARLVKDNVCGNHRVLLTPSPIATYSRRNNLDGVLQIGWECDDLVALGPGAEGSTAAATCPQDTYELRIYVTSHATVVNATGLKTGRVCSVEIDNGALDAIENYNEVFSAQTEMLFAYVGGDGGSMWSRLRVYEDVMQLTAFPTPSSIFAPVPTLVPSVEGAALPFAEISCGFDDLGFCGWINGGLGRQGWRLSTDQERTSAGTGPGTPYAGEAYAYVEASEFAVPYAGPFVLESPRFELNETPGYIAFQYHMFGSQMGNLSLEVSSSTPTWHALWNQTGNQGESWLPAVVELPPTAVRIRLVGYTGVGILSDVAVDDLSAVYAAPTPEPSAAPSVTSAPTISNVPTITPEPSSSPTALPQVTTRDEISAAAAAGEGIIWIKASTIVDFSAGGVIPVSTRDARIATALLSDDAEPAICDGGFASRLFAVFNGVALSLSDIVLRHGFTTSLGGALVVDAGSTLDLMRCVVESSQSALFAGALIAQDGSVVSARDTTFKNCTAPGSGGAVVIRSYATLYLDNCLIIDNHATRPSEYTSGGAILIEGARLVASGTQFRANTAEGSGGAVAVLPLLETASNSLTTTIATSDAHVSDSTWAGNFANVAGGAIIASEAELTFEGCRFVNNSANERGGALALQTQSAAFVNATDFHSNFVNENLEERGGGAILVITESSFTARFSTFLGNRAWQGGVVEMDRGLVNLYKSEFRENYAVNDTDTNWINCKTQSTLLTAKTYLDLDQTISARACSGYIYQINDDGSEEYSEIARENILRNPGSVSFDYYTYPCDAGRVSVDGVEHGDILDRNGLTIDENDPGCEPECFQSTCICPPSCEVRNCNEDHVLFVSVLPNRHFLVDRFVLKGATCHGRLTSFGSLAMFCPASYAPLAAT